jgi:hypothetical protein
MKLPLAWLMVLAMPGLALAQQAQDGPVITDASLSSSRGLQEKLACEDETKIEGYFLVDVVVEPSMVSTSEIKVLEDSLQYAYNDIASCDSSFRVLDKVTLVQETIASYGDTGSEHVAGAVGEQEVSYLFHVVGRCKGCNKMSALLKPQAATRGRELELNLQERTVGQGGLRKAQVEDAQESESCACEAPSKSSFLTFYQTSFSEGASTSALRDIKDVSEVDGLDPLLCSGDIVSFSETLIVELEICDMAVIDQDIGFIEESFVSTYNALVKEYCDPYFRFLETARVVEQGALTPAGNLPVELEVTGKCSGCDPDKASIYDFPTVATASSRMLMAMRASPPTMLEELNSKCYCKANALANRAPS